jgi:hypothetical protein
VTLLPHRALRFAAALAVTSAMLASAGPAHAERPDPKLRSAARALGAEGLKLFEKGKFEEALDRFERASKLIPAPTLGIRAARCLEKLGRLVEASERYLEVSRFALPPGSRWVHRKAVRDATMERDRLVPRIPELTIEVRGPHGDGIELSIDGDEVPLELIGTPHPIDPGTHKVVLRRRDLTLRDELNVAEGKKARVEFELPPVPPPPKPEETSDTDWRMWSWVAYGVGGGGLLAAIINGSAALAEESRLEGACPARNCPPNEHGAADTFDALRIATTTGFVVGGAGLAAGTLILVLAPEGADDESAPDAVTLAPFFGPTAVGLRGRF